ncbi:hypothetical protein GCM10022393_37630 [Aquimarina addita]|uniref:GDYXXLXY domain-containing protein n=1 Tax=Aquimarina addita TaxID=870485 RepID=A0ABP6UV04_9FLAO
MKTTYIFVLFVVVALVQIFVPAQMVKDSEDTLSLGTKYHFKTRPIDPTDPYRGKYITLDFDINSFSTSDSTYVRGDDIYVYLEKDTKDFATVKKVSKELLDNEKEYVIAKVTASYQDRVRFQLPFNKFYMEETKAYDAELAYTEAVRDSLPDNVYALVYIKEGEAVLKDVFINEISIQKYVEK